MVTVAHWDEVESHHRTKGEMDATWQALGTAAGTRDVRKTEPRAGHIVSRPAGTRVSHSFRSGPHGVTMLLYGTREPNDICWYPRSKKIFWRGIGVIGRVEELEYFDGEPLADD
jgi:uncharacterized cupin superfamily protein